MKLSGTVGRVGACGIGATSGAPEDALQAERSSAIRSAARLIQRQIRPQAATSAFGLVLAAKWTARVGAGILPSFFMPRSSKRPRRAGRVMPI
jgi:hypothetical protein